MKIKKYTEFVNEEFNDTPESYIGVALGQIKKKIDKMFEFQGDESEDEKDQDQSNKSFKNARKDSSKKSGVNFKDLNVRLESSEISKYSKLYDSLTVKFSDDNGVYDLFIAIDLKEALPKEGAEGGDFSYKDIKKCYLKFKKYDRDNLSEVIGQLTKNIDIDSIDEEFLINLKIEMDEEFGDEGEEFKIETK